MRLHHFPPSCVPERHLGNGPHEFCKINETKQDATLETAGNEYAEGRDTMGHSVANLICVAESQTSNCSTRETCHLRAVESVQHEHSLV